MVTDLVVEIDNNETDEGDEIAATNTVNDDEFMAMLMLKGTDLGGSLLGMKAANSEQIFNMYKRHSQLIGFSIKKTTSRRANCKGSPVIERYFACSCQGTHGNHKIGGDGNDGLSVLSTNIRNVSITRCKCEAAVRTQVNDKGEWVVVQHLLVHNHPFTPPQWQHHHRSERKISEAEGDVIKALTESHVAPSIQFRVAAAGAGGEIFVGHTKRDHINYVNRLKMRAIEGGDAATLINLLTSRQSEEPDFFFRVKFNDEGRLSHLFWRDSMMKEDYLLYGDVFIFDTTYRTNRYNLICGAFVGINNHWSNVMFGCAFLSDERTESFEWLFNVFNESMEPAARPVTIVTDQDQAITNAIEKIYPATRHRLCQWHIQQNVISHFGSLKNDRLFQNLFNKCLHGCYTESQFEETWAKMLKDYGLGDHAWFKRLYKHKMKWCTALNNLFFSAGILSSQRSESTNHAMGFQASKTTSVTDFFGIFETTVKRWRTEEERKEFNGIRSKPSSVFALVDLLLHASQVYTLELFRVFEKEFALAMGTRAAVVPLDDPMLLYRVYNAGNEDEPHLVTYDCVNNLTDCTCRKFQVMGMLCSHIIRILHMHSVSEIPPSYIKRRWTKFAKTNVWERLLPTDMRRSAANDAINWRRSMLTVANHLITKCQNVEQARGLFEKLCVKANDEVQTLLAKMNPAEEQPNVQPDAPTILDPVRCTTKGRSKRKQRNLGKKKGRKASAGDSSAYIAVPRLI